VLRILLVEDSADDAALLRLELEDAGLRFDLRQVASEEALLQALETFEPDVAVSDMNLPGYCGLDALALLHQRYPAIPLVLFTGAGCEADLPPTATVLEKSELPRLAALLAALPPRR